MIKLVIVFIGVLNITWLSEYASNILLVQCERMMFRLRLNGTRTVSCVAAFLFAVCLLSALS
jgi:hypothetical protein